MAGRLGGHAGGILSLLSLLERHQEAVEYDLIRMGLRLADLGSPALSWRDLKVIVNQAAVLGLPESAISRAIGGTVAEWPLDAYMFAAMIDELRAISWQLSGDSSAEPPKPLPRPGEMPDPADEGPHLSMDEVKALLAAKNPAQHQRG